MRSLLLRPDSPGTAFVGTSVGERLSDDDLAAAYAYPAGPWLRANMVATVDGAAQSAEGRSGGISGGADKRVFGVLRALADCVLVGASTVRTEGYGPARPKPGWAQRRAAEGRAPAPALAIVSGRLDLDPNAPVFTEAAQRTIVLTSDGSPVDRRAALVEVADVIVAGGEKVDAGLAVNALYERGLSRLLCEGGPRLLAQVAAAGALDELCLTVSPLLTSGGATRILNGAPLVPARSLRLAHVLEADGFLFCKYVRAG